MPTLTENNQLGGQELRRIVYPEDVVYHQVTMGDLDRIILDHLRGGVPVEEFLERRAEPTGDK